MFALTHESGFAVAGRASASLGRGGLRGCSYGAAAKVIAPVRTVGVGFFPEDDRAEFIMALETPPGSNMAYTRLKAQEAARITRAHPEVPTRTPRSAAARRARWTRATSTCASCRRTSASESAEEIAQVLATR